MTVREAVSKYASAAIASCATDNRSATSAQSSTRVTPRSAVSRGLVPKISGGLRRRFSSFLRMSSLQSLSLNASRTSIFHPRRRKHCAATRASPALWPFPANTMHFPGFGKNLLTACETPAPALSISASTSTPRAKAAPSAARICAEVKIGEFKLALRRFWGGACLRLRRFG